MTDITYEVLEGPTLETITELVKLAKHHNDGQTLSHQRILGQFIHHLKGDWTPEEDEESTEAQYCRAFLSSSGLGTPVIVVAREDTKIVGFGGVAINGTSFGHSFTIVDTNYRCRGIGKAIVKKKEDYVRERFPCVLYFVYVTGNGPMAHMSEKMGYTQSGTVMGKKREMKIYIKPARTMLNYKSEAC